MFLLIELILANAEIYVAFTYAIVRALVVGTIAREEGCGVLADDAAIDSGENIFVLLFALIQTVPAMMAFVARQTGLVSIDFLLCLQNVFMSVYR